MEEKYYRIYSSGKGEDFMDAYYAVGADGWSQRFVERGNDNSYGLASELFEAGRAYLPEASLYPLPTTEEEKGGYEWAEIDKEEFERQWKAAIAYARDNKLVPRLTGVVYDEPVFSLVHPKNP